MGFIFLNLFFFKFKKGPPDAVIKKFFISDFLCSFKSWKIEKCSESTGTISDLYLSEFFLIKSQPQIIDSLFAINIFLLFFIIEIVGFKPAIPGIAETVISIFFLSLIESKLLSIKVLLFLNFFSIILNVFLSLII